jgi:hypothetical protein
MYTVVYTFIDPKPATSERTLRVIIQKNMEEGRFRRRRTTNNKMDTTTRKKALSCRHCLVSLLIHTSNNKSTASGNHNPCFSPEASYTPAALNSTHQHYRVWLPKTTRRIRDIWDEEVLKSSEEAVILLFLVNKQTSENCGALVSV